MLYYPWIVPSELGILGHQVHLEGRFDNGQQLYDKIQRLSHHPNRVEIAEHTFRLDELAAERFNTDVLVYVHPIKKQNGIDSISVNRKQIFGPIVVCTERYAGFKQIGDLFHYLRYVEGASMPDAEIKTPKSFEQLMKEHGRRD